MRAIKFRGKTIRSKEWVYSSTISQGTIKRKANKWFMEISENVWKGLQEGSLGQFTGLYDKDGKEIYEGDLIEVNGRLFGVVEWHKDGYFFINDTIVGVRIDGGEYSPIGKMVRYFSNHGHDFSVIGNIHDNPELLTSK